MILFYQKILQNKIPLPFKCTEVYFTVMRIPHSIISDFRIWTGNLNTITILFLDHHQTQTPLVMLTHFDEIFDLCARRKACARLVFPVNYNIAYPMVAPIANPFLNDQILRKTSPPCQLVCTNPPFKIIMGIHKFTFEESRHVEAWYISVCFGSRQS